MRIAMLKIYFKNSLANNLKSGKKPNACRVYHRLYLLTGIIATEVAANRLHYIPAQNHS